MGVYLVHFGAVLRAEFALQRVLEHGMSCVDGIGVEGADSVEFDAPFLNPCPRAQAKLERVRVVWDFSPRKRPRSLLRRLG